MQILPDDPARDRTAADHLTFQLRLADQARRRAYGAVAIVDVAQLMRQLTHRRPRTSAPKPRAATSTRSRTSRS